MTNNPPKIFNDNGLNYPCLLGEESWGNLHPDIQQRFSPNNHRAVSYQGIMSKVYSSFAGKLLAQVCRIIGTPLALHSGTDIPIKVNVYPNPKLGGMTWDRFYSFPNKPINRVKSTKCIREQGLVEMVGFGFGMDLKVYEKDAAIYFESTRFFWQLGKLKITIPDVLSPGNTKVSQHAMENGRFEFRLEVVHSLLGRVFEQVGLFNKEESES